MIPPKPRLRFSFVPFIPVILRLLKEGSFYITNTLDLSRLYRMQHLEEGRPVLYGATLSEIISVWNALSCS
jgi:hypothetical protein